MSTPSDPRSNARADIFTAIRKALGVRDGDAPRREEVDDRLARHPAGVIPARGQLPPAERLELFKQMVLEAQASLDHLPCLAAVPEAIAAYLKGRDLPPALLRGADARLAALPWGAAPELDVWIGPSDGRQLVGLSHAFAGVAETGTLVLLSGPDNPTTLNFLPDHHLVVIDAGDVVGDYESAWARVRAALGPGVMPRVVNWITGPSRSADIEQTLLLGAHGPRSLHVLLVGESAG